MGRSLLYSSKLPQCRTSELFSKKQSKTTIATEMSENLCPLRLPHCSLDGSVGPQARATCHLVTGLLGISESSSNCWKGPQVHTGYSLLLMEPSWLRFTEIKPLIPEDLLLPLQIIQLPFKQEIKTPWSILLQTPKQQNKIWGIHGGGYKECRLRGYKNPVRTSQETHYVFAAEPSQLMLCEIWGFRGGDYKEWRLRGYKNPVPTLQETRYVSATEPSQLMLCEIWGFHGGDYKECRLRGYKNPVRTSQETLRPRYRAQPVNAVRFEVFTAVTIKNAVFGGTKTEFVPHRRHITSSLQSPVG
jgi:hypothetical protein